MSQNDKQNKLISPEDRIYMTFNFLFCFWSDTEYQLKTVGSFLTLSLLYPYVLQTKVCKSFNFV